MKPRLIKLGFALAAFMFLVAGARAQPQSLAQVGNATNFSSVTYFEPPHEQLVAYRLSGAEALPLPDAKLDLRKMKVEKFNVDGRLEVTVEAPQCTYTLDGVASSAGRMELKTGDGKFRLEGDGVMWQQSDRSLNISNHVHTVIKIGITNLTIL